MKFAQKLCKNCSSEFQCSNFCFETTEVEEFYRSQWQTEQRSVLYLIYRWIWVLFFSGIFGAILVLQFSDGKLFIFLTNWGIILCLLTNFCGAVLVTRWHFDLGATRSAPLPIAVESNAYSVEKFQRTPTLVKVYWLLHAVTLPLAIIITTVYWLFLHGRMDKPNRYPIMSFITHCLNSVFMIIDFWVVAFPVRLLHTVYAMLLPIFFCLFTVVYYFAGGLDEFGNPYVYPIIYWKYPGRGLITFSGVFLLYIVLGIILFLIFKFKRLIHRSLLRWKPHSVDIY